MMANAAAKRAEDSKVMNDKSAALAETEESLVNNKGALQNKNIELMNTEKLISELHAECDWLLKYYDARAEARTGEIEALGKAKAVLSGADYSLLQTASLRGFQKN